MLVHARDVWSIIWVGLYFSLTWWVWVSNAGTLYEQALAVCLLAYFSFSGACITHNSVHTRVFRSKHMEHAWHHLLSLTYGHPVCTFVPGHCISHHKYTQTPKDAMRTSKLRYRWNLLNLLLYQPTVALDVFKMDVRYSLLMRHCRDQYFWTCVQEWLFLLLTQAALIALDPKKFVMFVYLPHLWAQVAIVTMNHLQHDGCDDEINSINSARNFVGPVINFFTFNNGYHLVHHLKPKLHWSLLPAEHERLVAGKAHEALNQRCMATYMFCAYIYPGKRVDYTGKPVTLPPEQPDQDWSLEYAPAGVQLQDYAFSGWNLAGCGMVSLAKVLCPVYSPVFKVD